MRELIELQRTLFTFLHVMVTHDLSSVFLTPKCMTHLHKMMPLLLNTSCTHKDITVRKVCNTLPSAYIFTHFWCFSFGSLTTLFFFLLFHNIGMRADIYQTYWRLVSQAIYRGEGLPAKHSCSLSFLHWRTKIFHQSKLFAFQVAGFQDVIKFFATNCCLLSVLDKSFDFNDANTVSIKKLVW